MATLFDDLGLPTPEPVPAARATPDVAALVSDLNPQQRLAVEHRGSRATQFVLEDVALQRCPAGAAERDRPVRSSPPPVVQDPHPTAHVLARAVIVVLPAPRDIGGQFRLDESPHLTDDGVEVMSALLQAALGGTVATTSAGGRSRSSA